MKNDNTVEDIALTEDELDQSDDTSETEEDTDIETPEVYTFAGREFSSIEEAERAYKEMQVSSTKAAMKLSRVEAKIKAEMLKAELQELDPDERMARMTDLILEREELEEELETQEEAQAEDDTSEVESFAKRHPILREYPALAEQFVDLATTKYQNYKLEDIFNTKFKPLIDSLAGKKVTIRKKVTGGGSTGTGLTDEAISKMSSGEYEKRRGEIHKFYSQ